ncbi:MAG: J domain-containing protein [Synechococcaceae cyanobacterium]
MAESTEDRRRIQLNLKATLLEQVDALKKEWGIRNRGEVFERLLEEVFGTIEQDHETETASASGSNAVEEHALDEQLALVLVGTSSLSGKSSAAEAAHQVKPNLPPRRRGGIDLPGFVQRNTQQLRRSFQPDFTAEPGLSTAPAIAMDLVRQAHAQARDHWLDLYGQAPTDAVLEAAMLWLARDVWPQCDQSDGRSFTWSCAGRAMAELVCDWEDRPPSFEGVIVMAGILEDPFSAATLPLRIPTLIRSFTQRFRRRRGSTSFAMLEQTMTVQGALRTLQVHPSPDQGITLGQIREAYRDMALKHHPDSGGSVEAMRRINEAYQLLKELYRQRQPQA